MASMVGCGMIAARELVPVMEVGFVDSVELQALVRPQDFKNQ
jgi:hypothetical protein